MRKGVRGLERIERRVNLLRKWNRIAVLSLEICVLINEIFLMLGSMAWVQWSIEFNQGGSLPRSSQRKEGRRNSGILNCGRKKLRT